MKPMTRYFALCVLFTVFVLMVAAPSAGSISFAAQTPTAFPTANSTQSATAEATMEAVDLPEVYSEPEAKITFKYPQDWLVDSPRTDTVFIANSEDALSAFQASFDEISFQSGEIAITISLGTKDAIFSNLTLAADATTLDIMETWLPSLTSALRDLEFDEPEALEIGDLSAAQVCATAEKFDALFLLINYGDDNFVLLLVGAASGEIEQWSPTVIALAETVALVE